MDTSKLLGQLDRMLGVTSDGEASGGRGGAVGGGVPKTTETGAKPQQLWARLKKLLHTFLASHVHVAMFDLSSFIVNLIRKHFRIPVQ